MRQIARLSALLLAGLGAPPAARADTGPAPVPRTIIVMDGSGSMWGQIDGRPKLEIARQAVADVVASLPGGQEIGLIAYGHRSKGDCGDIEVLVPPAPGAGARIVDAVNVMRFLGKTPLSDAVRRAAGELRFTEEAARVVLVTDGVETCGGDPCALGAELEAAGLDFTAHVVGFGLSAAEGARVACLAEETGGRYIAANDAASLGTALAETVAAPPPAAPPAAPAVPGVMLFSEPDFGGESHFLAADSPDFTAVLRRDGGNLNDWASSARAVGQWEICEHVFYQGNCRRIEGDLPDLGEFSRAASSLRAVVAGPADSAGVRFDTDFFGADYASFAFDAAGHDWPDCAAACSADGACKAWTYVRPGRTEFGECFLKEAVPDASADPCCVSGERSAAPAREAAAAPPAPRDALLEGTPIDLGGRSADEVLAIIFGGN